MPRGARRRAGNGGGRAGGQHGCEESGSREGSGGGRGEGDGAYRVLPHLAVEVLLADRHLVRLHPSYSRGPRSQWRPPPPRLLLSSRRRAGHHGRWQRPLLPPSPAGDRETPATISSAALSACDGRRRRRRRRKGGQCRLSSSCCVTTQRQRAHRGRTSEPPEGGEEPVGGRGRGSALIDRRRALCLGVCLAGRRELGGDGAASLLVCCRTWCLWKLSFCVRFSPSLWPVFLLKRTYRSVLLNFIVRKGGMVLN